MMPARGGIGLAALSALSAGSGFAIWLALTWARIGTFEYPLDDVYIHLAMAEGIAGGTYGINPGEPASAASSILYPLLLLPFPGTALQRFLPLAWNLAGLLALAWMLGLWIGAWVQDRAMAVFLALVLPFATNMAGVASLGMEHTLHALAMAVLLFGFWRFLSRGEIGFALIAGILFAPMLRFEGIGLALAVSAVVALRGRHRAAGGLALLSLVPAASFALFLASLGLDPVPSSVLAKLNASAGDGSILPRLFRDVASIGGVAVVAAFALLTAAVLRCRNPDLRPFLAVVWLAVLGHLAVGRIGWAARYEHYVLVISAIALVPALAAGGPFLRGLARGAAVAGVLYYGAMNAFVYNWSARGVYLQHTQMAQIVEALAGVPVAVNDIGRVAWSQEARIVDLWGLAYADARRVRQDTADGPPAGWAGPLAQARGAAYAMVYDKWLGDGIGSDWQRVSELTTPAPIGILGSEVVSIYVIDPTIEEDLRAAIRRLSPLMPEGATLIELNQ